MEEKVIVLLRVKAGDVKHWSKCCNAGLVSAVCKLTQGCFTFSGVKWKRSSKIWVLFWRFEGHTEEAGVAYIAITGQFMTASPHGKVLMHQGKPGRGLLLKAA